jgi:apolipoprotein N-acyltransferase
MSRLAFPVHPLDSRLQNLVVMVSGVVMALSFPGFDWTMLAWIAWVPFFYALWPVRTIRGVCSRFALMGAGFFLTLLYWFLAMHPLTWLGFSEWSSMGVVTFAYAGASALMLLQLLGVGLVIGVYFKVRPKRDGVTVLMLALAWVVFEWLISLGPFGFTWSNLALTQTRWLLPIQTLDLVGPFPFAGLLVGFNAALALAIHTHGKEPWRSRPLWIASALVMLNLGYGAWRLMQPSPEATIDVQLVQGNLAGSEKWLQGPERISRALERYERLSQSAHGPGLTIWPETAVPTYLRNEPSTLARLENRARDTQRSMMFGTMDWEGRQPNIKLFNAVAAIDHDGRLLGFDYKRHLVPYGEYVPFRQWMPNFLMQMNIVGLDFYPGVAPKVFDFPFAKVGTGVCYDGIFPDAIPPAVRAGAELIVLVTNDAWYKDTAAPRVLNAHAVLRAIENRRWICRAATTGISSIIDAHGRVLAATPLYQEVVLNGRVAKMSGHSLFVLWGDWLSPLCLGLFMLLLLQGWWTQKRGESGP